MVEESPLFDSMQVPIPNIYGKYSNWGDNVGDIYTKIYLVGLPNGIVLERQFQLVPTRYVLVKWQQRKEEF